MIKAVIFDFDGTLSNSIPVVIELLDEVFHELNIDANAKDAESLVGMDAWKIIEQITGIQDRKKVDEIVQNWAKKYVEAVLVKDRIELFPDTKEVLSELRNQGLKIGIGTSIISKITQRFLKHYGLHEYIDAFTGADEVERGKPAPDIFQRTAEKLDVRPSETIIVGDAEYDIIGGSKMNAITVLFTPDKSNKNFKITPDYKIKSLRDLIPLIQELQNSN